MKNTPSPTLTVPVRRGGNYFGLGTYIGLAGALLVMGAEDVPALSRYQRIDAPFAVTGLEIETS